MVKRAKLTLDNQTVVPESIVDTVENINAENESTPPVAEIAQKKQTTNMRNIILITCLTLVSLVIFKSKIF